VAPLLAIAWTRRGKVLEGLAGGGAVLGILSLVAAGFGGCVKWLHLLATVSSDPRTKPLLRAEYCETWHGAIAWLRPDTGVPLVWILGTVAAAVVLVASLTAREPETSPRFDREWALVVVVAAFTSLHLLVHDVTILLVPAALALRGAETPAQRRAAIALGAGGWLLEWIRFAAFSGAGPPPPLGVLTQAAAIVLLALSLRRVGMLSTPARAA
jgi:hypothetical protein